MIKGETQNPELNFSRKQFIGFIESWFPEVRHLVKDQQNSVKKDVLVKTYLSEFVETIPLKEDGFIQKKSENQYTVIQPLCYYEGVKK